MQKGEPQRELVLCLPLYSNTKISLMAPILSSCHAWSSALLQTSQNIWLNTFLRIHHSPCCIRVFCRGKWQPLRSRPKATVNDTYMVFIWSTNVYCMLTMYVTFYSVTRHGSSISILQMIEMRLTEAKWIACIHSTQQVTESQLKLFSLENTAASSTSSITLCYQENPEIFLDLRNIQ